MISAASTGSPVSPLRNQAVNRAAQPSICCRALGSLQTSRDWVVRFYEVGSPGLLTGKTPGSQLRLTDRHRASLRQVGTDGPIPVAHGVGRCRIIDLLQ